MIIEPGARLKTSFRNMWSCRTASLYRNKQGIIANQSLNTNFQTDKPNIYALSQIVKSAFIQGLNPKEKQQKDKKKMIKRRRGRKILVFLISNFLIKSKGMVYFLDISHAFFSYCSFSFPAFFSLGKCTSGSSFTCCTRPSISQYLWSGRSGRLASDFFSHCF